MSPLICCVKALFYARKAYGLRSELFETMFCMKPGEKTVDGNRDVGSIYSYETFTIDQHVATTPWSNDEVLGETTTFIVTPWNTMQCFLESTLQVQFSYSFMFTLNPFSSFLLVKLETVL